MSVEERRPVPSRRGVLAAAVAAPALVVPAIALGGDHADAELIGIARQMAALRDAVDGVQPVHRRCVEMANSEGPAPPEGLRYRAGDFGLPCDPMTRKYPEFHSYASVVANEGFLARDLLVSAGQLARMKEIVAAGAAWARAIDQHEADCGLDACQARINALYDQAEAATKRALAIRPTTLAGFAAMARISRWWGEPVHDDEDQESAQLGAAILRALLVLEA